MAVEAITTADLLTSLTDALNSAASAFPSDEQVFLPPTDGISLLDVKNDLLLSYLQNLVFLILLRLRNARDDASSDDAASSEEVVKKLIELRVYMDRGVRPLEGRLRYQIDKVLRAADNADRLASNKNNVKKSKKVTNSIKKAGSDISEEESASEEDSNASDEEDDDEAEAMIHRPNAAALVQKSKVDAKPRSNTRTSKTEAYKPPRITPTAMPSAASRERDADAPSRRRKSTLVDEYIDEELSSAPRAQPSIGSNNTILARGRGGLSDRDRQKEKERTEYEERNFVRLPGESKAERRKARARGELNKRDMFGGEDWTGLGGLGDRINKTVAGRGGNNVLERRQKRGRDTEDGPRGDGRSAGIGDTFEKRRKVVEDRAERKRNKRR